MKKIKIICFMLVAVLALSFSFACNKNQNVNSSTDIQLYYWKSGLGLEFMQETVDRFNEIQDEYNVELEYDANASTIIQTLSLGESNTYDLYFTMLNTHTYDKYFVNLDDVLDSPAYGESVNIREKYYDYLIDGFCNADGTTHFLNYGNPFIGIVYNTDIIDGVNYTLPRTTNELGELVDELKKDGYTPWIFYNNSDQNGYWNYVLYSWTAQYEGLEAYDKEIMKLDKDGYTLEQKLLEKDGRFQALKALEELITPANTHPESTSTNFTKVQTRYLSGDAVLTVNGSWLLKETNLVANVAMMKTPVISSIVEKLENTSMSDETLRAIIDEVDAGETSSELCSQPDFDRIKEARSIMAGNGSMQYVFIPEYSPAKEGAKEFLRFFYSDEGAAIYSKATKLPATVKLTDPSLVDTASYPLWNRRQFEFADSASIVTDKLDKSDYYFSNGCDIFNSLVYAQLYIASNPTDRRTAEELYTVMQERIRLNLENMQ